MTELTVVAKSSDWEILEHGQNLTQVQSHFSQPFFLSDKQSLITMDVIITMIIFILPPPESLSYAFEVFLLINLLYIPLICVSFFYVRVSSTACYWLCSH